MLFAGCDLHKQTISVCVVYQSRKVQSRKRFVCQDPECIREFVRQLGDFVSLMAGVKLP